MFCKNEVDTTTTAEMGGYLNRLITSKLDPGYAADRYITPSLDDQRHVIAVGLAEQDFANTTPGLPDPAVSMTVTLANEQRFRVTVEEIR